MPTLEPVVNTMIPQTIEKPIPTRTVITRSPVVSPKEATVPKETVTRDQSDTSKVEGAADSAIAADSVKLSPQLTALARKEQALRQREQAFKAEQKAFEERKAEAEQYSQLKSKIASKDYSEAEKLGLNYQEYTQYLLDKQAGEDPMTQKFKALEDEIQALKKSKEESATQEYEETVAEYKKEIDTLVGTSAEFPRIKKLGRQDAVLRLILDSWAEDETELTVEEASKDVEAYLAALARDLEVNPPEVAERKLPPPKMGSRTLNQNMAAVGTDPKPFKGLQNLSQAERYAEAMRRAKAKLEGKI